MVWYMPGTFSVEVQKTIHKCIFMSVQLLFVQSSTKQPPPLLRCRFIYDFACFLRLRSILQNLRIWQHHYNQHLFNHFFRLCPQTRQPLACSYNQRCVSPTLWQQQRPGLLAQLWAFRRTTTSLPPRRPCCLTGRITPMCLACFRQRAASQPHKSPPTRTDKSRDKSFRTSKRT